MPIIKSAIKRVRQTSVRTARNTRTKRSLKQARRALDAALTQKSAKDISALLSNVQAELDKAVKKHLIHQNQASRLKARYAAAAKKAGGKLAKKTAKATPAKTKTSSKKPATVKKTASKKK